MVVLNEILVNGLSSVTPIADSSHFGIQLLKIRLNQFKIILKQNNIF